MDPELWVEACTRIEGELGWIRTHRWLPQTSCQLKGGVAILDAPKGEPQERLEAVLPRVEQLLSELLGRPIRARLARPRRARKAQRAEIDQAEPIDFHGEHTSRRDLGSFFVGPSNRLAAGFARQAVAEPGAWHPLVFYGGPGTGKTHLLQGIVNDYRRRYPSRRAIYTRSERFAKHFSQALKARQLAKFHAHYRGASLLVLDDLDRLAGKTKSETELTHVLDHFLLQERDLQVVVACRRSPKSIPQLKRGLEGRLMGGQLVALSPPDSETRRQVLRAACMKRSLTLSAEVEDYLSTRVEFSVQELIAAAAQLQAHRDHAGAHLDLEGTRRVLADLINARQEPATIEALAKFVALETGVTLEQLRSRSRQSSVIRARALAVGLARTLTPLTLREVGGYFGGRAPNSVHGAQAQAREIRLCDPRAKDLWERAERRFTTGGLSPDAHLLGR
ncbi:MAG: AAA family ATPase [Planctomycetes bacterium]|nr:AAA family ATPase [Planctomycetota bacterium]